MFNHNLISKTSLNSSLINEADILIYKLRNQFYNWNFECLMVELTPDFNNEEYYNNHNINILITINNAQGDLSYQDITKITKICENYYNFIHGYIEYKYFISKFTEDYEYYNNIYNWKFSLVLLFNDNNYIPIFNCTFSNSK